MTTKVTLNTSTSTQLTNAKGLNSKLSTKMVFTQAKSTNRLKHIASSFRTVMVTGPPTTPKETKLSTQEIGSRG
jgi:hypothetical protein